MGSGVDGDDDESFDQGSERRGILPRDALFALTLDDLLVTLRGMSALDAEETKVVGIRSAPVGFRVILGFLADEQFTSYSRIALAASLQGLALLEAEPAVRACDLAYRRARTAAMDAGDRDTRARLGKATSYSFEHGESEHTTFPVWRKVHARIVYLAMACGIAPARLAVLCIVRSILTRPNQRRYRNDLQDEIDAFLRCQWPTRSPRFWPSKSPHPWRGRVGPLIPHD